MNEDGQCKYEYSHKPNIWNCWKKRRQKVSKWHDIGVHPISTFNVWRECATYLLRKATGVYNGRDWQCFILELIDGKIIATRHLGTNDFELKPGLNVVAFVGMRKLGGVAEQYTFRIMK